MAAKWGPGVYLPIEKPEGRLNLQQRLEGQQIARYQDIITPADEFGFALELTNLWRFLFWSAQDRGGFGSKYKWRLVHRAIPAQRILTKTMVQHYMNERKNATRAPEELGTALQERVEGQVIVGVHPAYEPNGAGGERLEIEFREGSRLRWDALPPRPGDRTCRADVHEEWIDRPARTIITPGEAMSGPSVRPILIVPN